ALRNCDSSRRSSLFQNFLIVVTPSITRIADGAHTRIRPVTAIGSRVQLFARSRPERLPQLHESLAELTHGASLSRRSEVVFNSSRDLVPRDSLDYANRWQSPDTEPVCHGDWKTCSTLHEISSRAKELCITFRPGIGIANVTTIRNRHFEMVDGALVSQNSVPVPKFPPERAL
ncbi:hypothetical protein Taro_042217, partial [Colocasia esculenta]|nr:hypothetical protein [Colocasia esculenta]